MQMSVIAWAPPPHTAWRQDDAGVFLHARDGRWRGRRRRGLLPAQTLLWCRSKMAALLGSSNSNADLLVWRTTAVGRVSTDWITEHWPHFFIYLTTFFKSNILIHFLSNMSLKWLPAVRNTRLHLSSWSFHAVGAFCIAEKNTNFCNNNTS